MKKILLVLILLVNYPAISYAQTPENVSTNQVMSKEDADKLREQLAQLSKAMGNNSTEKSSESPKKEPESKNSIGDVANKALDMFGSAVASISANLSKIAPQVWRIMILQQYAKALEDIIVYFGLLVSSIILTLILRKKWLYKPVPISSKTAEEEKEITEIKQINGFIFAFRSVIPVLLICLFSILFFVNLSSSIAMIINPEYYAIKDILTLVLPQKQMDE